MYDNIPEELRLTPEEKRIIDEEDKRLESLSSHTIHELYRLSRGEKYDSKLLRKFARRIEQLPYEDRLSVSGFMLYRAITGKDALRIIQEYNVYRKPLPEEKDEVIPIKHEHVDNFRERLALQTRLAFQELYAPESLNQERIENLISFCCDLFRVCMEYNYEPLVTICRAA